MSKEAAEKIRKQFYGENDSRTYNPDEISLMLAYGDLRASQQQIELLEEILLNIGSTKDRFSIDFCKAKIKELKSLPSPPQKGEGK